jgi:hypothetical protein
VKPSKTGTRAAWGRRLAQADPQGGERRFGQCGPGKVFVKGDDDGNGQRGAQALGDADGAEIQADEQPREVARGGA